MSTYTETTDKIQGQVLASFKQLQAANLDMAAGILDLQRDYFLRMTETLKPVVAAESSARTSKPA